MCMLQGVTMAQVEAMPICGFLKSSSVKPTARSMARAGAASTPSMTWEEYLRRSSLSLMALSPHVQLVTTEYRHPSTATNPRGLALS
ncbi:hypothetical protein D3C80_1915910 [compost metagenome]